MNSRRQRYFRANSPSNREMEVLDQNEMVLEGDPGDDQRVSHEEIVDDAGNEISMGIRQHGMQQMHYEDRHSFTVPPGQPRRPGRPMNRFGAPPPPSLGMMGSSGGGGQKMGNKAMYMQRAAQQAPITRISPGGARIVSLPRKREGDTMPDMVMKRYPSQHQEFRGVQQRQQSQGPLQKNKIRLASGSARQNAQHAEQALQELEEKIRQTAEDTRSDLSKIKEMQGQEMTQEEYSSTLSYMLSELERLNGTNQSLTDFYRQRQKCERNLYEVREDSYLARIRQLETENRKLREAVMEMHQSRIASYEALMNHDQVQQHEELEQLIERAQEDMMSDEHQGVQKQEEEVPPEWIVEETVDAAHIHDDQVEIDHQNGNHEEVKDPKIDQEEEEFVGDQ